MKSLVESFIYQFTSFGKAIEECFTCGNCYWFAFILKERFRGHISYDPVANHFGCWIDYHIYDITGDVTNKYNWVNWNWYTLMEPIASKRIERDCIELVKN